MYLCIGDSMMPKTNKNTSVLSSNIKIKYMTGVQCGENEENLLSLFTDNKVILFQSSLYQKCRTKFCLMPHFNETILVLLQETSLSGNHLR